MSAAFEAVTYGKLFYEFIEIDEINALKRGNLMHLGGDKIYWWRQIDEINALKLSKGKFDASCVLSPTAKDKIYWWRQNILNSSRKMISAPTVDYIIHTDAGNLG